MTTPMIILMISFLWFTAVGLILPINAYLAAGRGRGDRAAAAELARRAAESPLAEEQHLQSAA